MPTVYKSDVLVDASTGEHRRANGTIFYTKIITVPVPHPPILGFNNRRDNGHILDGIRHPRIQILILFKESLMLATTIREWCDATVGEQYLQWDWYYCDPHGGIVFRRPEDAVAFKLRGFIQVWSDA